VNERRGKLKRQTIPVTNSNPLKETASQLNSLLLSLSDPQLTLPDNEQGLLEEIIWVICLCAAEMEFQLDMYRGMVVQLDTYRGIASQLGCNLASISP
jgi:hypothetical protein